MSYQWEILGGIRRRAEEELDRTRDPFYRIQFLSDASVPRISLEQIWEQIAWFDRRIAATRSS